MSTMQSIGQVHDLRMEVTRTNAELRTLSNLAVQGRVSLRDFLVLARMLTGGDPKLSALFSNLQLTIAVAGTATTALKALNVAAATTPIGMLALGVTAAAAGIGLTIYESYTGT